MTDTNLQANLFIRYLHYFKKHPINQEQLGLGYGLHAGHMLILGAFDIEEFLDPRRRDRSYMYRSVVSNTSYCMSCNSICHNESYSSDIFTQICKHCTDSTTIEHIPIIIEETKYYNPMPSVFTYLGREVQELIIKLLVEK